MKRSATAAVLGVLLAIGGLAAGCGSDETDTTPTDDTGLADSSTTETTPLDDTGTPPDGMMPDAPTDTPVDGDAGPLDFADFVKGLIATETKPTTLPTTVDDKTFVDKQDQAQFKELFP